MRAVGIGVAIPETHGLVYQAGWHSIYCDEKTHYVASGGFVENKPRSAMRCSGVSYGCNCAQYTSARVVLKESP